MNTHCIEITESNFDAAVVESDRPVLIDFWAPWCGPCKAMGPTFEALAEVYGDRMTFAKCNVDDNPAVSGRMGIRSIPTLVFFSGGGPVRTVNGLVSRKELEAAIEAVLTGEPDAAAPFQRFAE